MIRGHALYEGVYLLGTSIARPLIAKEQIAEILNPILDAEGYELVEINLSQMGNGIVQLVAERLDEKNITIDDCINLQLDYFSEPGKKMKLGYMGFKTVRPKAKQILDILIQFVVVLGVDA